MGEPTTEAERRLFARVADLNRERIPDLCPLGTTPGSGTDADSFRVGDLRELEAVVRQLRRELAEQTERTCPYDPELDATPGACAAWWRGDAHGFAAACQLVTKILDGQDDGSGVSNEPWESVRRRLLGLWAKVAEQTVQVECLEKTLKHNQGILTAMGKLQDEQAERIKGLEAQIATQRAEIHTLQHDLLPAVEAFAEKAAAEAIARMKTKQAERVKELETDRE